MKKSLYILLIFMFIMCSINPKIYAMELRLECVAGVVIDQESGRVLYEKNGARILPMASTTKILTAIVAIEKGNLKDTVVVSKTAAAIGGSNVGLKSGEKIKLEELLYGLMLRSGNDAAIAIAEFIGNDVSGFVEMMNDKALEIGAFNSHFQTPHGLDKEKHYTTALDLARITAYAMKNETFSKIVSTKSISTGVSGDFSRQYENINKFLFKIENADGVKTGYTGNAGKCLVASVKHDYGRYICVVLNSNARWKDAEKLTSYANKNYKFVEVFSKKDEIERKNIYGGNKRNIKGKIEKDFYLPVTESEIGKYELEIYSPTRITAPIKLNEIIGNIVVSIDDKIVAMHPIYSDREVKRRNFIDIVRTVISQLK